MNLSSDTVNVLKNFSDINQNILVKPGNKIQTISTMKNILAEAEVSEKFEDEFAIYDLPEFLRSVELFEKPELKFNGGTNVAISEEKSRQNIKYFFADKSVIVSPTKSITASAPLPFVSSIILSISLPSINTPSSPPKGIAWSSAVFDFSTIIIFAAHIALKHWIAIWPNPPAPIITQFWPGNKCLVAFLTTL